MLMNPLPSTPARAQRPITPPPSSSPLPSFPSTPTSASFASFGPLSGLGYGELEDGAPTSSSAAASSSSQLGSASGFGRTSSVDTVLGQPMAAISLRESGNTPSTLFSTPSRLQGANSSLGGRSSSFSRSPSFVHPFSGSASATSPHPAFSKEDQERKYQGRKQQGSPAPGSPIPDSAQAWSLSSDSWVDRQQQSSTPTKPRKDLYDNERTFGRTGSVNVKKAALAAGGRLSLGPTARDEETPRSRSRRIVHDAVANAVSKAELTVHLDDKGLVEVPAQIRDLADVMRISQPPAAYTGLHQALDRRYVSAAAAVPLPTTPPPTSRDFPLLVADSAGPPPSDRQFSRTVSMPTQRTTAAAFVAGPIGGGSSPQRAEEGLAALRTAAFALGTGEGGSPTAPTRGLGAGRSALGRSTTVAAQRPAVGVVAGKGKEKETFTRTGVDQLYLGGNFLTVLPTELFQLETMTFLSLTKNNLTRLPASISCLSNLVELYIGNNQITTLPPSLLRMTHLRNTVLNPNPFFKLAHFRPPRTAVPTKRGTYLTPAFAPNTNTNTTTNTNEIPKGVVPLQEICLRALISSSSSSSSEPTQTQTQAQPRPPYLLWGGSEERGYLRSPLSLRTFLTSPEGTWGVPDALLPLPTCARLLAALRSSSTPPLRRSDSYGGGSLQIEGGEDRAGEVGLDDASQNPFYDGRCPCGGMWVGGSDGGGVETGGSMETRIEWSAIPGRGKGDLYPVRWEGCRVGCLRFLDDDDEETEGEDEEEDDGQPEMGREMERRPRDGVDEEEGPQDARAVAVGVPRRAVGFVAAASSVGFVEQEEEEEESEEEEEEGSSEDGFDVDALDGGDAF